MQKLDCIIIGAGFSGLYQLHCLRDKLKLNTLVIEEGKDIIRSTNGGISAHINAKGEILRKIKSTDKGVIEVKSYKKNSKTFFSIHGNKIFFYFAFFYIILFFFLKKKENR